MNLIKLALTALIPLVASFASVQSVNAEDYIKNAAEIVKKANWDTMKTITVKLDEHSFDPDEFEFEAGQAYKLELINVGEKKHYFTAPEFFRNVATRKVLAKGRGEIKAPYFLALEMFANGGQLDFYFVPVTKGEYPLYCTIDDHREQGMEGALKIK
jgi:uncharacterized cupredoxin-like copper-binding protein